MEINRRDFLRLAGIASGSILVGCPPNSNPPNPPTPKPMKLDEAIPTLRWTSYAPTNFNPNSRIYPNEASVKEDFATLIDYGFEGLITYESTHIFKDIPKIALDNGFKGVIMGIWDPNNNDEIARAKSSADYVSGYCVGNEGLEGRYTLNNLISAKNNLASTGKPVTTAEQIDHYFATSDSRFNGLLDFGDFFLPNAHPFWFGIFNAQQAVTFVDDYIASLQQERENKLILVKETGYPTSGDSRVSEQLQKDFYTGLAALNRINFSYFEAFDQYWKNWGAVEPHWGLFDVNRNPKLLAQSL